MLLRWPAPSQIVGRCVTLLTLNWSKSAQWVAANEGELTMFRHKTLLALALLCSPMLAMAQADINNGTVKIGVRADGALMPDNVGLTYIPTGVDGLMPGCKCEAWGIADGVSMQSGFTGDYVGTSGITTESFASTATTATSVVNALGKFRVTHSFSPSASSAAMYDVKVTVQNISEASTQVLYGRAMDWDIPFPGNELVTMQRGNSPNLIYSSDDGFYNADPLGDDSPILFTNQDIVDSGPADHGAHFQFNFGSLAPGASLTFTIGYGAEMSTAAAMVALTAFDAESYSLGKPSETNDGTPNTFIFAFKGTGGTPINTGTCAGEGYKGTKLLWCKNICEKGYTGGQLDIWIHRWINKYRDLPQCAQEGGEEDPPQEA